MGETGSWSQLRSRLRLGSALVLLIFVVCHLVAHSTLLLSERVASSVLTTLMGPWRSAPGTALLITAGLVHYANAIWSIYARRSLRLKHWEWAQLGLGLCIPLLLALHLASTRISEGLLGTKSTYAYILVLYWAVAPAMGLVQVAALLTVWLHGFIGLHFWLRTKRWYPEWRGGLGAFVLLLPTLALAGYVSAGNALLLDVRKDPMFVPRTLHSSNAAEHTRGVFERYAAIVVATHAALVLLVFVARSARRRIQERRRPVMLRHPSGCALPILPGASVLETLRDHGVPHASVCGGRARCTTCRIHIAEGLESLPPPEPLEAKALARIGATPGMRLACQLRPSADLAITPLLAAAASADDGFMAGGLEGSERLVTVMFVDLRESTALAEAKLPYDVLFILNRFFAEMKDALAATNGHYSQFTGDGLMALYGLYADDPSTGPAEALRGAREMLVRLAQLNRDLEAELPKPLRIGIGIHYAEAIVGAMGPPRSQIITAIGDTVNTAARLESLTKDYGTPVVISRRAAETTGIDLRGLPLHEAPVKGRVQSVQFYALGPDRVSLITAAERR